MNLEPRPTLKKMGFFWSNPYKIEGVITSLIEMLELPNFGHMITSTIRLDSSKKKIVGDVMDRSYDVIIMSKYLILRGPRVAIFAEIIKIVTMLIKTIFKDSKNKL